MVLIQSVKNLPTDYEVFAIENRCLFSRLEKLNICNTADFKIFSICFILTTNIMWIFESFNGHDIKFVLLFTYLIVIQ